jgi:hypothetical protein
LEELYSQVTSALKDIVPENSIENDVQAKENIKEINEKINYEMVMQLFEVYKLTSSKMLHDLRDENVVRLRFYYYISY